MTSSGKQTTNKKNVVKKPPGLWRTVGFTDLSAAYRRSDPSKRRVQRTGAARNLRALYCAGEPPVCEPVSEHTDEEGSSGSDSEVSSGDSASVASIDSNATIRQVLVGQRPAQVAVAVRIEEQRFAAAASEESEGAKASNDLSDDDSDAEDVVEQAGRLADLQDHFHVNLEQQVESPPSFPQYGSQSYGTPGLTPYVQRVMRIMDTGELPEEVWAEIEQLDLKDPRALPRFLGEWARREMDGDKKQEWIDWAAGRYDTPPSIDLELGEDLPSGFFAADATAPIEGTVAAVQIPGGHAEAVDIEDNVFRVADSGTPAPSEYVLAPPPQVPAWSNQLQRFGRYHYLRAQLEAMNDGSPNPRR